MQCPLVPLAHHLPSFFVPSPLAFGVGCIPSLLIGLGSVSGRFTESRRLCCKNSLSAIIPLSRFLNSVDRAIHES